MTRTSLALAKYRLEQAHEALRDSHTLRAAGSLRGALNRVYYAAFHAARALLATKGLDASKHSGVIALFRQHFVKTGLFDEAIAKILPWSFEERMDADYEDFVEVDAAMVDDVAEHVRQFVTTCERWLNAHTPPHHK